MNDTQTREAVGKLTELFVAEFAASGDEASYYDVAKAVAAKIDPDFRDEALLIALSMAGTVIVSAVEVVVQKDNPLSGLLAALELII